MLRDLIIVIPGIMGSILQRGDEEVWNPGPGLAKKLFRHRAWIESLALAAEDDPADTGWLDGVVPARLVSSTTIVPGLFGIEGYSELHAAIETTFGDDLVEGDPQDPVRRLDGRSARLDGVPNYYRFAYDWRRDVRVGALRLHDLIEKALTNLRDDSDPNAQVVIVAHSMGGLLARYYMHGIDPRSGEPLEGWRNVRELLTFGTPYRGSPDAFGHLTNGMKKLFADFSETLRTFTGVYHLLPRYPMVLDQRPESATAANPNSPNGPWRRPHEVADVPDFSTVRARSAYEDLHLVMDRGLKASQEERLALAMTGVGRIVPHIGFGHATANSAILANDGLRLSTDLPSYLDPSFAGGDGTVPAVSAIPPEYDRDLGFVRYTNQKHGSLQVDDRVLSPEIRTRLLQTQSSTGPALDPGRDESRPDGTPSIGLDVPLVSLVGETCFAIVVVENAEPAGPVEITITDLDTKEPIGPAIKVEPGRPVPLPERESDYRLVAEVPSLSLTSTAIFAVIDPDG